MLEGMYTAAAGMAAQQQRLDAVAGDLANVNTTGYKKLRVAFRDLVYTPTGPGASPGVQEGAGTGTVRSGALEGSGVDAARTMVDMIASMRAFEAGQRVITTIDSTLDKAANQVGRVA